MKRYLISTLLLAVTVAPSVLAQHDPSKTTKHFSDAFSVFEAAITAAPKNSEEMQTILAAYWDLLPNDPTVPNHQERIDAEAKRFFDKFGVYPDQVDLSKDLTQFRKHVVKCNNAADTCKKAYSNYQTLLKDSKKKSEALQIKVDEDAKNLTGLSGAINQVTVIQKSLLQAIENLRAAVNSPVIRQKDLAQNVADAYKGFVEAMYLRHRIGQELGLKLLEDDVWVDSIVNAQLGGHDISDNNQEALKTKAQDDAEKLTINQLAQSLRSLGIKLEEEIEANLPKGEEEPGATELTAREL